MANELKAVIETSKGTINLKLFAEQTPVTVGNFVNLARRGYYNDLIFDDVIPGEIVFGGCARGDGRGNAGLVFPTQAGQRPFGRGTVGIAESDPDTGSGRFFITLTPRPDYDGRKTLLGWVVDGIETAARLRPGDAIEWIEIWDGE